MSSTLSTSSSPTLTSIPEELLDRILFEVLSLSSQYSSPRPSWHPSFARTRIAPLLVCRLLTRIGKPHLYHTVCLPLPPTEEIPTRESLLLSTLAFSPALATNVRFLSIGSVSAEAGMLMALCQGITHLEITLDGLHGHGREKEDMAFVKGLQFLKEVRHLTVRKPGTVYLSLPRARSIISGLAKAIEGWVGLVSIRFLHLMDRP